MNRGSDSVLSVYSDARAEYTKQLCMFLVPAYFQFYIELLEKAKQATVSEPKRALWQFQTYMNEIHDWNMEKVNHEIHTIHTNCGCDYLEDLLTAVFIAHTKVLTAIRLSANNKKVEINVPKVEHFLFKVLCETAKLLWSSTYLFRDGIPGMERQQNYRNIEQVLNEGILQAVRNLVPVKSILKDFMNMDVAAEQAAEEDSDEEEEKEKEKESIKPTEEIVIPSAVSLSADIPIEAPKKEVKAEEAVTAPTDTVTAVADAVTATATEVAPVATAALLTPVIAEPKESLFSTLTSAITGALTPAEDKPTIVINDKPAVTFGKYNTVFSAENPEDSDLIIDAREDESYDGDHIPALKIMDDAGQPLGDDDFDILSGGVESIGVGDYEEL
jgi:hypothetical protein